MVVPDGAADNSVAVTFVVPSHRGARPTTCVDLTGRQEALRRWSPVAQRTVLPDAVGSLLVPRSRSPRGDPTPMYGVLDALSQPTPAQPQPYTPARSTERM